MAPSSSSTSQDAAKLVLPDGKEIELPVITGSEGEKAVDISQLRKETGYVTLDPGFANTGSCESNITFLNGEQGILRYRGYPIEQLAEQSSFLEVAWLLTYGDLPSSKELENWTSTISRHTLIHEDMKRLFDGFPRDAHPMAILSAVVSSLYTFYQEWDKPRDPVAQELGIIRLLAKLPTLAAFSYKKSIGQPFIYPDNNLSYCANFMRMMFATPAEDYFVDPDVVEALDLLLILHADHEQNCSTSTVRLVGSSLSNLYASVSSGISALWGPLHGGANQRVIEMLQDIAKGGDVKAYVEKAKDKNSQVRLMGFGHRVYKNHDPRATILKASCHKVMNKLPVQSHLLEIALELEEIALEDEYFIQRKLYPNVDFYSGIIYEALSIPVNGFTVMFALGRLPGWIAQWREMLNYDKFRIGRPRQVYCGPTVRDYIPVEDR